MQRFLDAQYQCYSHVAEMLAQARDGWASENHASSLVVPVPRRQSSVHEWAAPVDGDHAEKDRRQSSTSSVASAASSSRESVFSLDPTNSTITDSSRRACKSCLLERKAMVI